MTDSTSRDRGSKPSGSGTPAGDENAGLRAQALLDQELIAALRAAGVLDRERIENLEAAGVVDRKRISDLEALGAIDREMIVALKAEGVLDRTQIAHLEIALMSARMIGAAIGIVMSARRCSQAEAFQMLATTSQNSNRRLREVAQLIVAATELN